MKRYNYLGALALGALGACSNAGPADPNGVTIKVAPLDLPGVTDASYTITVKQGAETVWSESSITADQYGNGKGDITYIGTCDADDGIPEEGPATATNTVELVLESLNGGAITEFQNPCPATKPCTQEILCTENADAQVTFNITIMRDANQGFFDIAVNFQDLFCSAKFDCEYEDGTPIHLLFDGSDRAATAVLAFACTSGDGGSATNLYLNDIHVDCSTEDSSVLEMRPTSSATRTTAVAARPSSTTPSMPAPSSSRATTRATGTWPSASTPRGSRTVAPAPSARAARRPRRPSARTPPRRTRPIRSSTSRSGSASPMAS
ncbi:MAG: hypothetical protein U1F43_06530 [Myxococcota bacterium]